MPQLLLSKTSTAPAAPLLHFKRQLDHQNLKLHVEQDVVLDYDDPPAPDSAVVGPEPNISAEPSTLLESQPEPELDSEVEGQSIHEDSTEENKFYYSEGALTSSLPFTLLAATNSRWHTSLLSSFCSLRASVHAHGYLSQSVGLEFPRYCTSIRWRNFIINHAATPYHIRAIDHRLCLKLIGWFTGWFKSQKIRQIGMPKTWGRWLWGVLVRVDECLAPEEVANVRALGKAALAALAVANVKEEQEQMEEEEEEEEDIENYDSEIDVKKGKESSTQAGNMPEGSEEPEEGELSDDDKGESNYVVEKQEQEPHRHESKDKYLKLSTAEARGIIDMVISIVGDFFGQRDLLEERKRYSAWV